MTAIADGWTTEITLKNTLFGWKYSVDDWAYRGVGLSGRSLILSMTGNQAAQDEVLRYRSCRRWGLALEIIGGFTTGFAIGGLLASEQPDKTNTALLVAGVPVAVIGIALNAAGSDHLKKAVRIFNGEERAVNLNLGLRPGVFSDTPRASLCLSLRF